MTKLVVVESPYSSTSPSIIEANVEYARRAMADCLARDEFPIASHLLYTQPGILDDTIPEERKKGMTAGLVWGAKAGQLIVFYCDRGISSGMEAAAEYYHVVGIPMECRWLDGAPEVGSDLWYAAARLFVRDLI